MRTVPVYIPDPDFIDRQLDDELAGIRAATESDNSFPARSEHPDPQRAP